jgi:phosphoglycerate dehydrogenase-like enzyme
MAKVLITPATLVNGGPFLDTLRAAQGLEVVLPTWDQQLNEDGLLKNLKGITATVAGSEPYTRRVLDKFPELRAIARVGVGYDAIDMEAANERGIAVCIAPGTNQESVAEHTFSLLLALTRNVANQHIQIRQGNWPRRVTLPLRSRVLGIAGLGRIGKAVAVRGAAFNMKLLAYEPYPDDAFVRQYNITLVPFERLLAESDYLTLHMPATKESKHLINCKTLAQMKRGAMLINTARGSLVNEADLVEALKSGQLAGAGLDVFEQEPPGKTELVTLDNVVCTAHTAGVDIKSLSDMALSAAQAIAALSKGEWPAHQIVNNEVRAKFKWA